MNNKLKIYLDTSVVSYLLQEDVPEKMEITNCDENITTKMLR